jgi:hypothetical protein
MLDCGKVSLFFIREWSKHNPETRANRYAADLLMPLFMFKSRAATIKRVDFTVAKDLAKLFCTSLTATAIRLVEHVPQPAMLVCSSAGALEWFVRGDGTKPLWPKRPSPETYAHDVLSVRAYDGLVLTLLWWRDERMLIRLDDVQTA